jgi:hypothetical protein
MGGTSKLQSTSVRLIVIPIEQAKKIDHCVVFLFQVCYSKYMAWGVTALGRRGLSLWHITNMLSELLKLYKQTVKRAGNAVNV